jgi:hypothetical protein
MPICEGCYTDKGDADMAEYKKERYGKDLVIPLFHLLTDDIVPVKTPKSKAKKSVRQLGKEPQESSLADFVSDTYVIEPDAGPITVRDVTFDFKVWRLVQKKLGKPISITILQAVNYVAELATVLPRNSNIEGIRHKRDDEDSQVNTLHMP